MLHRLRTMQIIIVTKHLTITKNGNRSWLIEYVTERGEAKKNKTKAL